MDKRKDAKTQKCSGGGTAQKGGARKAFEVFSADDDKGTRTRCGLLLVVGGNRPGQGSTGTAAGVANSEGEHVVKLTAQEMEIISTYRTLDDFWKEDLRDYTKLEIKFMQRRQAKNAQKEKPLSDANAKRQSLKIFTNDRTVKSL